MHKLALAITFTLCLAFTSTLGWAEEKKPDQPTAKPQGLPVETIVTSTAPLSNELSATGTLYSNESVVITAEVAGKVTQLFFDDGEKASAGQILLQLDQSVLTAERDRAQANLSLSEANIRRAERLLQEQAISERERDEAYAKWRLDEASLRLNEAQLAKTVIKAPFSGMLGLRRVSIGEYLQPGETIVTLDDIDPIKVDFRVPEVFAHQLRVGQAIRMNVDAVPGRTFTGKVFAIDPQIDVNGRSVMMRAKVVQEEGPLRPGMFARIALVLEERPNALMIPEEALIPGGDRQQVFKVVDGKVEATVVETGLRTKGKVEITKGLEPGETIITAGQIKVRPGMPVTALPATPDAAGSGK
ncbi:MAG: efflux RND transporter periplasmic adaptor subunit [Desulfuromonadales bacterium]